MENTARENRMGTAPIGKLLISMSAPLMASMLVQALYNVVDSIFVSRISEKALTALSLSFPIQNLMIAVATGTGVGINALLSRSLGEKKFDRANKAAENGLMLALFSYLAFLAVGLTCIRPFFQSQTQDEEIIYHGVRYLSICSAVSFGLFGQVTLERILQATGKSFETMISQMSGAIFNIIFDPLLIFGIGPFPELGSAGAAIATVGGQILAMFVALYFNRTRNEDVHLKLKGFRPDGYIVRRIYIVGVPSIAMASIGSIMIYGINRILLSFVATAATVYGVYFKLQSFVFMPVFGLNNGMVPVVAYNYGARRKDRIMKAYRTGILIAECIMVAGMLMVFIFPEQLLRMFKASDQMLEIGVPALRIICVHFPIAAFCIVTGSVFQALGNGFLSLIVSVCRQLLVLLPVAYLLSLSGDLNKVWLAFPIAELMSLLISSICMRWIYRKEIQPLGAPVEGRKESVNGNA